MEDKKVCPDLEEDEELASLRLAALRTLKTRSSKKPESDIDVISNILPINSITRITDSLDHGSHKNKHSWRNNIQASKRKGKNFLKPNQRSNLIVITPIGTDNKKSSTEKLPATQLILPQHKWFQQNNEDSSSPRTDRKTGPSRFNRHGSGSESSDSDYDESDDSYSNETILLDERSRLSPARCNESNTELNNSVCSERRLSFQNLDSNLNLEDNSKNENADVYKCTKTYSEPPVADNVSDQKETELTSAQSDVSNHNDRIYVIEEDKISRQATDSSPVPDNGEGETNSPASSPNVIKQKSKHIPIKFDLSSKSDHQKPKKVPMSEREKSLDTVQESKTVKNHTDPKLSESSDHKMSSLSKNDLRFELKRKKANVDRVVLSSRQNKLTDSKLSLGRDRSHRRHRSWSRDRSASSDRKNYKRSRSRECSRTPDHKRSRYNNDCSSSRSSRSSSSSSNSTSSITSSDSGRKTMRSISSVIQPVQSKIVVSDNQSSLKSSLSRKSYLSSSDSDPSFLKKAKNIEIKLNPVSNIKISVPGNDHRSNAPEVKKRGPVHMRLGTLPRKRIIQMPKDVEAAFVTTSSDDDSDVNSKCKKSNILVVTELCDKKVDGFSKYPEKRNLQRSEVPNTGRGRVFR